MKDFYSAYHPAVGFLHFAAVMAFTMLLTHPVCIGVSLACAAFYALTLRTGSRRWGGVVLLSAVAAWIINPLFNHEGATILYYFRNGNPLTLESVLYGAAAAGMFATALLWFYCYGYVLTSDKTMCVLGGVFPSAALIMSMIMRLVPKFKARLKEVASAQGAYSGKRKRLSESIGQGLGILSIMFTWLLEDSIGTADSMKARGYGLKGRTHYSAYGFHGRDRAAALFMLAAAVYVIAGAGALRFGYFPVIRGGSSGPYFASLVAVYAALCAAPLAINLLEGIKWSFRKNKA